MHNNLNKFKGYKKSAQKENFYDLSIKEIEASEKSEEISLEFKGQNSHWLWLIQENDEKYKGTKISKNLVIKADKESKLDQTSYVSGKIDSFIEKNQIVLQIRRV